MQKEIKLIPANKDSRYQIKENEKGFYHLKFVLEMPTADEANVITDEKFQTFSVMGFKQYLENKKHFNFKSEEIIHDPTIPDEQQGKVVEVQATQPEKTQPYFGSEKHKADLLKRKQSKTQ